jgi:Peptidase A4 family
MKTRKRIGLRVEELEGRWVPSTLSYSTNWSGYAVNTGAGAVSQVAGSWVVPAVSSSVSGYSSAWVGIDGWSSSSVEQIGTDSDYVNGQARYYAWYEMYPAAPVNLSLTIHPGDTMSASVSYAGLNQFVLSITDVSTGGSFSTTQTLSSAQRSSAEWIQEAPSSFTGVLPLANFGTINFSGANATVSGTPGPADNSWSGTSLYQINMVTRNGRLKATTSALSDSGIPLTSSFSVTWVSSGSSSGHGGGHKATNVPPTDFSPTTLLLSTAVTQVEASRQETPPPAFVATESAAVTKGSASVIAAASVPPYISTTSTFAPFAPDTANSGGVVANQTDTPEWPLRNGYLVPVVSAAAAQTDGVPTPQADPASTNWLGASLDTAPASDTGLADTRWLPAVSLDVAPNWSHEERAGALAGLVLTFAIIRTEANARRGQTGKRDSALDRSRPNRLRLQPWR